MKQYPTYIVDAFTDKLFGGNQAAVMPLQHWLPSATMQAVATENNLAETAFVVAADEEHHYRIRWFSPLTEIDFCGHATLAAAWVLFEQQPQTKTLYFHADAVGILAVSRQTDRLQMRFPIRAPEPVSDIPPALLQGLSIAPQQVLRSSQAYFAVYADEADVRALTTDDAVLKQLAPYDVTVTAPEIGRAHV